MTDIKIEGNRPEAKEIYTFKAADVVQSKKTECIFMVVDNNKSGARNLMRLEGNQAGEIIQVSGNSLFYSCKTSITVVRAI